MASGRALWVALGLAGCAWQGLYGCAASPPPTRVEVALPRDPARALIELVPEGGDECEVVRTARAPDARLPLLARIGTTSALAWRHGEPRIIAYVATSALSPLGGRARRVAVELSALPRDRDLLEDALGLRVRWEGEPCDGVECRYPVVRSPRERVLVIEHGEWPSERVGATVVALCRDAVSHDEDAVSVSTELSVPPGFSPLGPVAHRTALVLREGGVEERTTWVFEEDEDAARYAEDQRAREEALGEDRPARVELRGRSVVHRTLTTWDELELAQLDAEIALRIRARSSSRHPVAVEAVDVADLREARRQLALRETAMSTSHGPMRRAAASALATLLVRTLEAHPHELDLAERAVRVLLDELADPARARPIAERVLGMGAPPERWARLVREARVRSSLEEGVAALVDAGMATPDVAPIAVPELRAIADAGFGYEWAEAMWSWARALSHERAEMRPVHGASLRGGGALGAIALVRDVETHGGPGVVALVARARIAPEAPVVERVIAPDLLVPVLRLASLGVIVGVVPDDVVLADVSRALFDALPPDERVMIDLERHAIDGGSTWRARVEVQRSGAELRVLRVDASLAGAPWATLDRQLAQPLTALRSTLFPAQSATLDVELPALAARLAAAVPACTARGSELTCSAPTPTERASWVVATLRALLAARLASDAEPPVRSGL